AITDIGWQGLSMAFVFVTLATAIYSVEKVAWVSPQPSLLLTLLLSVLTTLVLTKVRLPAIVIHGAILLVGAGVYIWQFSALVAPHSWWQALHTKPNESSVYFTSFLIWGAWLLGYISGWFMLQKRNAWVAISLSVVVILINLNNLPAQEYYKFFPIYVLAAVLLLGYTHMTNQIRQLEKCARGYTKRGAIYYASTVIVLSVLVATSSALLPSVNLNPEAAVSTKISWNNSQQQWYNILAAVGNKLDVPPVGSPQNTQIRFADPPSEDKTLQYSVNTDASQYVRVRRYDNYLSTGWTSANTVDSVFNPQEGNLTTNLLRRKEVTYTVTSKVESSTLLVTGEIKSASVPVWLQAIPTQASTDPDIVSVLPLRLLLPNTTYTVTSWVSEATPQELFQAGTDYPDSIKEGYMQLPTTLPDRLKELSLQLTEHAQTPYEKAIEIKNFLQRFTYNLVFNNPPTGVDPVDYFVFEKKAGDCTYFASAMAVMLRSVGVPARISSGYRLMEKDTKGQYLVRARDYHARTEVYFPEYGWIEFEVTPGLPGLSTGIETVNFGDNGMVAADNLTHNITMNATGKVKVHYVNYDEFGNLLDEFGDPIYQDAINLGALPPNLQQSPSLNVTSNASPNATAGATQNLTPTLPSGNVTANQSANTTHNASANATLPASSNTSSNTSPNTTPVLPPKGNSASSETPNAGVGLQYPPFLIKLGLISLVGFLIGLVLIVIYQLWLNRIKRSHDAGGVYSRMCMLASLSKFGPKAFETPSEYGLRLAAVFPGQESVIDNITQIYGESRFGKQKELPPGRRKELERSWFQLYPVLIKRIFRF
ncbi:MAG: transglutaminase domain-containing protein, partial [Dehalococcoidales bacterium]|nr:transglutaminase domain-containing protein [Dehalococcoidales bacterium]